MKKWFPDVVSCSDGIAVCLVADENIKVAFVPFADIPTYLLLNQRGRMLF